MARTDMTVTKAPPYPKDSGLYGQDYADKSSGALEIYELEKFLTEIRDQPDWRRESDIDAEYYDSNQLTADQLEKMRMKGFPPIIENLIRPTIDAVLGLEAKTRTDWIVRADNDRWSDVALAMSAKLKQAEREGKADKACSEAYAHMIKSGVGWVEVSRSIVPNRYPYRIKSVHRREISWDWRELDAESWRYLLRRRWFDRDVVAAMFPDKKDLIEWVANSWQGWYDWNLQHSHLELARSWELERASTIEAYEYRDYLRQRLCLYELWYRRWKSATMLTLPDGRMVEFDRKNGQHVAAVNNGWLIPEKRPMAQVRCSFWLGPHRIMDIKSPYPHQHFPYVPFFAFREDLTGVPYGLIRPMRPQQDEVNARKAKMMWLLSAKRVRADKDAVEDHQLAKDEVSRPDAYIVMNPARRPTSIFEVDDQMQLSEQQFKIYQDAKKSLQDVAGVYQAMLGKPDAGVESGVAISRLIEQGQITLAEVNDNYQNARRMVGELLMELVRDDIANGETIMVGEGPHRKEVTLNLEITTEFGPQIRNDVKAAGLNVTLDDMPQTTTFRQQQLVAMAEFSKSLPDEFKALFADYMIENTDFRNRHEIAERVRQRLGIQDNRAPRNEEEAKQQQAAAQEAQEAKALQKRAAVAEVANQEADANYKNAQADKLKAEIQTMGQDGSNEVDRIRAESERKIGELTMKHQTDMAGLQRDMDALRAQLSDKSAERASNETLKRDEINARAAAEEDKSLRDNATKIAIARIEAKAKAASEDTSKAIADEIKSMNEKIQAAVDAVMQKMEKRMAKIEEQRVKDQQKAEAQRLKDEAARLKREEAEAKAEAKSEKSEKSEPAAPANITVGPIIIEQKPAAAKTITGKLSTGESVNMTVKPEGGKNG